MQVTATATGNGPEPEKWESRWNEVVLKRLMNGQSARAFAKRIGIPHQTFSRQVSKNAPQMDAIAAIVGNFPDVSPNALIQIVRAA